MHWRQDRVASTGDDRGVVCGDLEPAEFGGAEWDVGACVEFIWVVGVVLGDAERDR